MDKLLIYCSNPTARFRYSCELIFKVILKVAYTIVTDPVKENVVINYGTEKIPGKLQVEPHGLLEEKGIKEIEIAVGEYSGLKTIFHSGKGDVPFDIFSAVFYMCSRYEEYLHFNPDEHGRFRAEDSIAYKNGFHQVPIVELWVSELAKQLGLTLNKEKFRFKLTIDIDSAWRYKNRGFFRNSALLIREFLFLRFKAFSDCFSVLLLGRKDPWDTYDYLDEISKELRTPIQFFVLVGRSTPFDKAVSIRKKEYRKLIYRLKEKNKVGIHPSYGSNSSSKQLDKEFYTLAEVDEKKPLQSRQHYLKLKFPDTFRHDIKLGITEEYSLGWPEHIGFRAGTSRPYPFYDLLEEKQTHLQLVPLIAMDRTLKDYMKLKPNAAIKEVEDIAAKIKDVGGQFTMLWHNASISNHGEWKGWRKVFETVINYSEVEV